MSELTFRLALAGDFEILLELLQDLHRKDLPATEAQLSAAWSEIMQNKSIRHYLAEMDGVAVAACHLVVVPNLTRGAKPYGMIENVVTKKAWQRQGIGTRLLRHVLAEAWALGCYKVMLMTGREDARSFYEKAGFKAGVKTAFVAKPEELK